MKGLVLAAGEGKRLKELNLKHKSLAEVKKKHVIDYSLDLLSEQKVLEIVVVVGYHADDVVDYIGTQYKGIPVKYAYQEQRLGIAHAIKIAKPLLKDDFVLCLADEILINPRLGEMIKEYHHKDMECLCGVIYDGADHSMKPIAYDIEEGEVVKVREKPDRYTNDIRGIGECIFSAWSLEVLEDLQPNPIRNEYEMGDWIQMLIDRKPGSVKVFDLADGYANINRAEDIVLANDMMESN